MLVTLIDRVGEWNPQLFREIKGRLTSRNLVIATSLSLIAQGLVYLCFRGLLPPLQAQKVVPFDPYAYPRSVYCLGEVPEKLGYPYDSKLCIPNALNQVPIHWQRWWLDLFITLSLISIIALLVVGVYMLIADVSREERRGTLGFVRLSPQTASSILTGKMLGVPILLYWTVVLALPLHLVAGVNAQIPLPLIFCFYLALGLSCACFYSASLLYALVSRVFAGFQAWLGSGLVLGFVTLFSQVVVNVDDISHTTFDWAYCLYPGIVLPYLIDATGIDYGSFLQVDNLATMTWFGQHLWVNTTIATLVIVANFSLLTYWIWHGLNRRFHHDSMTVWSKSQSYWLSGSIALVVLGFVAQVPAWQDSENALMGNFAIFLGFQLLLMLGVIAALTPHRQTLYDWARYRHQDKPRMRSFLPDLIRGENSPAILAIGINVGITLGMMLPLVFLVPLEDYRTVVLGGMIVQGSLILLYAGVAQLFLLMKTPKRAVWAAVGVGSLIVVPFGIAAIFTIDPFQSPLLWLFSAIPVIAIEEAASSTVLWSLLGQWSAITVLVLQMQRHLGKAGESTTKQLMTKTPASVA